MSEGFDNGTSQFYGEPQKNNGNNGMAIASMVVGIVAVVLSVIIFVLALIGLAVIGGAAALSGL